MHHHPNFFIISGGPGSGKTTIVDLLAARGFATVGEAGRDILREQAAVGGNAVHTGDAVAYRDLMLARALADYARMSASDEPVFFDRGIAELVGYCRLIGVTVPAHIRDAARTYRSNAVVFLTPPWPEIYRQDAERRQDLAEATRTFELIRNAYDEAGYRPVEVPRQPAPQRAAFILAAADAAMV